MERERLKGTIPTHVVVPSHPEHVFDDGLRFGPALPPVDVRWFGVHIARVRSPFLIRARPL